MGMGAMTQEKRHMVRRFLEAKARLHHQIYAHALPAPRGRSCMREQQQGRICPAGTIRSRQERKRISGR